MRYNGFIMAVDIMADGRTVYKLRVRDASSPLNNQKLVISSFRNGVTLAQGANVTFEYGTVTGPHNEEIGKAFDVELAK